MEHRYPRRAIASALLILGGLSSLPALSITHPVGARGASLPPLTTGPRTPCLPSAPKVPPTATAVPPTPAGPTPTVVPPRQPPPTYAPPPSTATPLGTWGPGASTPSAPATVRVLCVSPINGYPYTHPQAGARAVDVRHGGGCRADQQCRRAGAAPRSGLAPAELRHAERGRQPLCRAPAHGGHHVTPARARCARLPHCGLHCGAVEAARPPGGRPRSVNLREVVNAIFSLNRQGCVWRALPHDLPPWGAVSYYYRRWRRDGTWQAIHDTLRTQTRRAAGREESPSAAIMDSQSVKTTEAGGPRGCDGGKLVKGRKRHLLVDTLGLVLLVVVLAANVQDRDGAKVLVERVQGRVPRLQRIWADGSYTGPLIAWIKERAGWLLEIVQRSDSQKGFVVLPKRWIVERTFGWFGRYRRLSKDYEATTQSSEAMIHLAMIQIMLRRRKPA